MILSLVIKGETQQGLSLLWDLMGTQPHMYTSNVHKNLFGGSNLKNVPRNFPNTSKANLGTPHPPPPHYDEISILNGSCV